MTSSVTVYFAGDSQPARNATIPMVTNRHIPRRLSRQWHGFATGGKLRVRSCTMPELKSFRRHEMPRDLAWQIRSFTRIQWPHLDSATRAWWDFTPRENNSIHFVLTDGDLLVSHASVNWRDVEHAGTAYDV